MEYKDAIRVKQNFESLAENDTHDFLFDITLAAKEAIKDAFDAGVECGIAFERRRNRAAVKEKK